MVGIICNIETAHKGGATSLKMACVPQICGMFPKSREHEKGARASEIEARRIMERIAPTREVACSVAGESGIHSGGVAREADRPRKF